MVPTNRTTAFVYWAGVVLLLVALSLSGCRSSECARMLACCEAVQDTKGVGEACGARASSVRDAETCQTILQTVEYMFEERDEELPEVCRLEDESSGG